MEAKKRTAEQRRALGAEDKGALQLLSNRSK